MKNIIFKKITAEILHIMDFSVFREIFNLMLLNRHKLFDDEYFNGEKPYIEKVYEIIEEHAPYFWLFYDGDEFLGFCYLYDIVPFKKQIISAFATICFKKTAFGLRSHYAAKKLLRHEFEEDKILKIKAETYSNNIVVPNFLASLGFRREGTLKNEIITSGKLLDTEIWAVFNPKTKEILNSIGIE